jgi:hypothetical protein
VTGLAPHLLRFGLYAAAIVAGTEAARGDWVPLVAFGSLYSCLLILTIDEGTPDD